MTKTEYKALLFQSLDCELDGLTYEERMQLSETYLVEYQIKQEDRRERPNRRKPWTDEELYAKYGLTDEEINFIESMIKPMDIGGDE